jgi:phosphoenolpyruvate carboxykinase (GTP)
MIINEVLRRRPMNSTIEPNSAVTPFPRPHISPGALANDHVHRFVHQALKECLPDQIYWCNGSDYERRKLTEQAVEEGGLIAIDPQRLPGFYVRGGASDHGPCGERPTLVCTATRETAAPAENWMGSPAAHAKAHELFHRCMAGRTMFVVPFLAGPCGSTPSRVGILITDSIYVTLRIGAMTATGDAALRHLGASDDFTRCLHSVGHDHDDDKSRERYVFRFLSENMIHSYGSNHPFGREELFIKTLPGV